MAIYLDPKADLTFWKVFGEHKELMISFLNAMLPLPDNGTSQQEPATGLDKVDEVQRKLHEAQAEAKRARDDADRAKAEGEKAKALAMARNMIADGIPTGVVAKYTGLAEEEIKSLLQ